MATDEGEGSKGGGDGKEKTIKKVIRQILSPEICYDILKNISNTDCMIMGIDPRNSRPEDMIHKIFPVSPVAIRPSAKVDFLESSSKEDDLTHKLADIVKVNIRIRKLKESSGDFTPKYGPDNFTLLQFHIYTNFDNESAAIPKSEQRNKATKSLSSRLKGKEGQLIPLSGPQQVAAY
jgi:DNA-directed RNA polymerase II subunit RPB1